MKAMTVMELRELLAKVQDDAIVVLSTDSEGNGYAPALWFEAGAYYRPGSRNWVDGQLVSPDEELTEQDRPAFVLIPG